MFTDPFRPAVYILWCMLAAVVPSDVEETREETQMAERAARVLATQKQAILDNDSAAYLKTLSPELREKHRAEVEKALCKNGPGCHNLMAYYKHEIVSATRSQVVVKAKITIKSLCPTGYKDNVEYATLTMAPAYEDDDPELFDNQFISSDSSATPPTRLHVVDWKTEKTRSYDPKVD